MLTYGYKVVSVKLRMPALPPSLGAARPASGPGLSLLHCNRSPHGAAMPRRAVGNRHFGEPWGEKVSDPVLRIRGFPGILVVFSLQQF